MHHRLIAVALVATLSLMACGSDDSDADPADTSAGTATSAAADSTSDAGVAATTTTGPGASASSSASPPTTPNEGAAAQMLLTPEDLPGWQVQPEDEGDDGSGSMTFTAPECAALQALGDDPALADEAEVTLVSPDDLMQVNEQVTVGDPAKVQEAFRVFADPATTTCLQSTFTAVLQQPGRLPDGVALAGLTFEQQPLNAGEEAIGYVGTITVTGTETGITAPFGIRIDSVRQGEAIALLMTMSMPGAEAVDPNSIVASAAARMTV